MLPTGKRFIHSFIHSFTRWLNVFLILALLVGLLPPARAAAISHEATASNPNNGQLTAQFQFHQPESFLPTLATLENKAVLTPPATLNFIPLLSDTGNWSQYGIKDFPFTSRDDYRGIRISFNLYGCVGCYQGQFWIYHGTEEIVHAYIEGQATPWVGNFSPTTPLKQGEDYILRFQDQNGTHTISNILVEGVKSVAPDSNAGYLLRTSTDAPPYNQTLWVGEDVEGSYDTNSWIMIGWPSTKQYLEFTFASPINGLVEAELGYDWYGAAGVSGNIKVDDNPVQTITGDTTWHTGVTQTITVNLAPTNKLRFESPGEIRIQNVYLKLPLEVFPDSTLSADECPFCGNDERVHYVGGPINTQSGNYNYETTDLTVAAVGQPLTFERSYNSLTTMAATAVYSRPLGYGWTHSYDLSLAFEGSTVILKAPHGSRLRFQDHQDGTYSAYPGVWATLIRNQNTYTVTAANQEKFVFARIDNRGYLTQRIAPVGTATTFSRTNGITLTQVTDAVSGRSLHFGYDDQGRLNTVSDSLTPPRTVRYGYDTAGDLRVVTDTLGNAWRYTYTGTHLLWQVWDPAGKLLEQTDYQSVNGTLRAVKQSNGQNQTLVTIAYQPDQAGNQVRTVTELGRTVTDRYNSLNLLIEQTDALNRSRSFGFDPALNRTGLTDERGNDTGTARTPLGFTTAITDALNQPTYLAYDGFNHPTVITDARGTVTTYTWNPASHTLAAVGTVSGTIQYGYNGWGQALTVTNRLGQRTTFGYDSAGNLITTTDADNHTTRFGYDSLGRVITVTNARSVVSLLTYDPADHVTRLTENYTAGTCPAGERCNRVTEYGYDPAGRLVTVREFRETGFRETRTEYNNAGQVWKITRNYKNGGYDPAAPDEDVTTRYEYDEVGRLRSLFETVDTGVERETRLKYDSLNRVDQVVANYQNGTHERGTNPDPPDQDVITVYAYENLAEGRLAVTATDDLTGQKTRWEYDRLNRLEKVISNYRTETCPANECNLTTRYEYDAVSNLQRRYDPLDVRTEYRYDRLNRLTGVTENYTGDGVYAGIPDQNVTTGYRYDNEGNLTRVDYPLPGRFTLYRYTAANRLRESEDALGRVTRFYYDPAGNPDYVVDPISQTIDYTYDSLNQLTGIDYPEGTAGVSLEYDLLGRRTEMTDGSGSTVYGYDDLDRPETVSVTGQGPVGYGYDALGRRTRLTYPDSSTVTYTYDRLDRLETVTAAWAGGLYDYSYNDQGRLASLTRPDGLATSYGYDGAGRLDRLQHRQPGRLLAVYEYTLDQAGNISQTVETLLPPPIRLPLIFKNSSGGAMLYLAPPAESQPTAEAPVFTSPLPTPEPAEEQGSGGAEEQGSGGVEDPPTPEPAEPAPEPTLTPDSPSGWQQNLPGWLRDLAVSASSFLGELFTPTTPALASSPFSSPIGIQGEESLPPVQAGRTVITTTYDSLYRLTSAIYSDGRTYGYTYDATGNRLSQTTPAGVTTYGYNNANQLVSANGVPYTYDNNGNLTNDGVYTYGYDAANRLTAVTNGTLTTQYQYNGDGDRTRHWLNGTDTRYALDPVGLTDILAETTGSQTTRYLPGLTQVNGSNRQYFLPDRLGSVRLVMPSVAGAEPALLRNYDPFGKLSAQSGLGSSTFGYTGEPLEPLGGLVYLRARYYQPSTGRFLIPDPFPGVLRVPGTLHPYLYTENNPVNRTDPSGYCGPTAEGVASGDLYPMECIPEGGLSGRGTFSGAMVSASIVGGIALGYGVATVRNHTSVEEINQCFEARRLPGPVPSKRIPKTMPNLAPSGPPLPDPNQKPPQLDPDDEVAKLVKRLSDPKTPPQEKALILVILFFYGVGDMAGITGPHP